MEYSIEYFNHILFLIFLILLWIKCRFWNRQPISCIYTFTNGHIITDPVFNKYCDVVQVLETTSTDIIPYLQSKSIGYETTTQYMAYLQYAYITAYGIPIKGCMTSRRTNFFYDKRHSAYYHDYIHADSDSIRRTLFQTHEYLRCIKTKCGLSIFSCDHRIPFLIPITRYPIHWVKTNTFIKYPIAKKSFIRATPATLYTLYEVWKRPFQCQVSPELDQIAHMIQSKVLSIYYYYTSELCAILFFKNTSCIENNECILDWIGTISLTKESIQHAVSTLFHTFRKVYPILRIHQLSHTPPYAFYKKTERVYYIYNYGIKRISPKDCLFI